MGVLDYFREIYKGVAPTQIKNPLDPTEHLNRIMGKSKGYHIPPLGSGGASGASGAAGGASGASGAAGGASGASGAAGGASGAGSGASGITSLTQALGDQGGSYSETITGRQLNVPQENYTKSLNNYIVDSNERYRRSYDNLSDFISVRNKAHARSLGDEVDAGIDIDLNKLTDNEVANLTDLMRTGRYAGHSPRGYGGMGVNYMPSGAMPPALYDPSQERRFMPLPTPQYEKKYRQIYKPRKGGGRKPSYDKLSVPVYDITGADHRGFVYEYWGDKTGTYGLKTNFKDTFDPDTMYNTFQQARQSLFKDVTYTDRYINSGDVDTWLSSVYTNKPSASQVGGSVQGKWFENLTDQDKQALFGNGFVGASQAFILSAFDVNDTGTGIKVSERLLRPGRQRTPAENKLLDLAKFAADNNFRLVDVYDVTYADINGNTRTFRMPKFNFDRLKTKDKNGVVRWKSDKLKTFYNKYMAAVGTFVRQNWDTISNAIDYRNWDPAKVNTAAEEYLKELATISLHGVTANDFAPNPSSVIYQKYFIK